MSSYMKTLHVDSHKHKRYQLWKVPKQKNHNEIFHTDTTVLTQENIFMTQDSSC